MIRYIIADIFNRLTNFTLVLELLLEKENTIKKIHIKSLRLVRIIQIKMWIYFIFLFLLALLYFTDVFCGVYSGSQKNWFENNIVSILISLLTSLGYYY